MGCLPTIRYYLTHEYLEDTAVVPTNGTKQNRCLYNITAAILPPKQTKSKAGKAAWCELFVIQERDSVACLLYTSRCV